MAQCIYRHMPNFYQWVERRNFENFDCLDVGPKTIPRWSPQNRPMRVTSKPANGDSVRDNVFYSFTDN
jgi:hypothetical protein